MKKYIILLIITVIGFLWWQNEKKTLPKNSLYTVDYNDINIITKGKQIYDENCASCHGANLEGEKNWKQANIDGSFKAPPHNETGHTWHHPDITLFNIVKNGNKQIKTDMPIYAGILNDDEIWAVIAYIKSTWSDEIKEKTDMMNKKVLEQING